MRCFRLVQVCPILSDVDEPLSKVYYRILVDADKADVLALFPFLEVLAWSSIPPPVGSRLSKKNP